MHHKKGIMENQPKQHSIWDIDELIHKLDSEKSTIRCNAARALGELKHPKAVDALIKKINHMDKNTKNAVIEALGNLGDKRAVEPLAKALKGENFETLELIKTALAKLDSSDIASKELMKRNLARGASKLNDPGVIKMIIGGGITVFGVITSMLSFISRGEPTLSLWNGLIGLGLPIFIRGWLEFYSN